jgi:prophage DNA circulation protein
MSTIKQMHTPWRDKYKTASFRGMEFHVETDGRGGGRRVALHQYPKRNTPYAEDMGRTANRFLVQGYLIGRDYLDRKEDLITALEMDGPGMLRLPMPYQGSDVQVMVQSYSISESREKGGFCTIDMDFVEYGDPVWRANVSTPGEIQKSANNVEQDVVGNETAKYARAAVPYAKVYAQVFMGHS